eukprot:scaffold30006_cov169-Isochrysis_galbana.AAC.1
MSQLPLLHVQRRVPLTAKQRESRQRAVAGSPNQKNRPAVVNDDGGVRDRAVTFPNWLRDGHEFFVHRANRPRGLDGAVLDDLAGSGPSFVQTTSHGRRI